MTALKTACNPSHFGEFCGLRNSTVSRKIVRKEERPNSEGIQSEIPHRAAVSSHAVND